MTALFIIALVFLAFMVVINLIATGLADDEMKPYAFINFIVMAFAVVVISVWLGS